jgi:hypothetical protein
MAKLVDQYKNLLGNYGINTSQAKFESDSPILNKIGDWIKERIAMSQQMLDDAGRVASRRLRDGIEPLPVKIEDDGTMVWSIVMEAYYDFVNKGVNGQEVNHGSPYSFTDRQPPSDTFLMWMAEKGINRLEYVDKAGEYISKQLVTQNDYKSMAYLIARGVKKKGIVPIPFVDDVFNDKAIDELVIELQKLWQ